MDAHRTSDVSGPFGHVPVMLDRMVELIARPVETAPDTAVVVDCTLGAGGHSEAFLTAFPEAIVIGLDRDSAALAAARTRLERFGERFVGIHTRFDDMASAIAECGHPVAEIVENYGVRGFLFDLGVSSMQLDQADRGFAYAQSAPLDMRMDTSEPTTAADLLNTLSHGEIAKILKTYGDERFAGKIATAIVQRRRTKPLETSDELVELIYDAVPAPARRTGGHPAKRTFQALRVAVNKELESIRLALPAAMDLCAVGGRVVTMSYQSHEDRIVKDVFTQACRSETPPGLPMDLPGTQPRWEQVVRGCEKATREEIDDNPRAQSVRVRCIQKRPIPEGGVT